ncbi:MAG: 3'-5' exonuclease [Candidatus Eremiobacteraeota bacterium]|nr:3'-5' exonuclease [Candidatus Eremiobacteraeota bacterium]
MDGTPLAEATFAFLDVETTGISPTTCAVVEVACMVVRAGRTVAAFETLIDPVMRIPPFATSIHGISNACVAGAPRLDEVLPHLQLLVRSAVIVAHNARFDLGFLPSLRFRPVACSWRLAVKVCTDAPNHKNQTLRRFFNIDPPELRGRFAHRAMADVIVTRHVFDACLERYAQMERGTRVEDLLEFLKPRYSKEPALVATA